jgi:hypothetical protein
MQSKETPSTNLTNSADPLNRSGRDRPIKFRFIRVFAVTVQVIISLAIFDLQGRVLGSDWVARNQEAAYGRNARR